MRNLVWDCFWLTGDIDAYLLYKDIEGIPLKHGELENNEEDEEKKEH